MEAFRRTLIIMLVLACAPASALAAPGDATTTAASCVHDTTNELGLGQTTTCRAIVTDAGGADNVSPSGTVTFTVPADGAFSPASCTLGPLGTASSECTVQFVPSGAGGTTRTITATYVPGSHLASNDTHDIDVAADGTTFVVNSGVDSADDGVCDATCTLREAIGMANGNANAAQLDRITFSSALTTVPGTPLVVSERVEIDATSVMVGSVPAVVLDGTSNATVMALSVTAPDVTIKGVTIRGFNSAGVTISGARAAVESSFVGTNTTGTAASSNGIGIAIAAGGNDARIGGGAANQGNLISGNTAALSGGVNIAGGSGARIVGNRIGTDAAGTAAVPNVYGVKIAGGSGAEVGDAAATPGTGFGNVISGNSNSGVRDEVALSGARVQGNLVGTSAAGTAAVGNVRGVSLSGQNTRVGGTGTGEANVISGNTGDGVVAFGDGTVSGNRIGVAAGGAAALPNGDSGVSIEGPDGLDIADNVISGNGGEGVFVDFANSGSTIANNLIGLNAGGAAALGNTGVGVELADGASATTISGNAISANAGRQIRCSGCDGSVITGNRIGTDIGGTEGLSAGRSGIELSNGASGNQIGDTAVTPGAAPGNLITGLQTGVIVNGAGATNTIRGNVIGMPTTGSDPSLFNSVAGISVTAPGDLVIGGTIAGQGNVIAGNAGDGIVLAGAAGTPSVQGNAIGLDTTGASLGNGDNGVEITTSNVTLGGSDAAARNVIAANGSAADEANVLVEGEIAAPAGPLGDGNEVVGNFIGTNGPGDGDGGGANVPGVLIRGAAANTEVGDDVVGTGNVISGGSIGVELADAGGLSPTGTTLQRNRIGTNAAGTAAIANVGAGVVVGGAASSTSVGVSAAEGNRIAGNFGHGVQLTSTGASNVVRGNVIGLDVASAALANGGDGIRTTSPAAAIGGTAAGDPNVVSGNTGDGIRAEGTGTTVRGNTVGLNPGQTATRSNGGDGVVILGDDVVVDDDNVVSGNTGDGVEIEPSADNADVLDTRVGTNGAGTLTGLGNGGDGIRILGTNAEVGRLGDGNLVAENDPADEAVRVEGADVLVSTQADGASVAGNTIGNATLPDGNDTVLVTGDADGAVVEDNSVRDAIRVSGQPTGVPAGTVVRSNTMSDPAGHSGIATSNGAVGTVVGGPGLNDGNPIGTCIATCIRLEGASGEVAQGNTTTNALGGFAVIATSPGAQVLDNAFGSSAAATINASGADMVVSGNTITGAAGGPRIAVSGERTAVRANTVAGNAQHGIDVTASDVVVGGTVADGNVVTGANSGIRVAAAVQDTEIRGNRIGITAGGVAIGNTTGVHVAGGAENTLVGPGNRIAGNVSIGVLVGTSSGTAIRGNVLGLGDDGTTSVSNDNGGVVTTDDATAVEIGGAGAGQGNVISGGGSYGVELGSNGGGELVRGNAIGTNETGTGLPSARLGTGIHVVNANAVIGGVTSEPGTGAGNVIAGSSGFGVWVTGVATGTVLRGNVIGLAAAPNGAEGVASVGTGITIGGPGTDEANVIAHNAAQGITIGVTSTTDVQGNRIHDNGDLGIDAMPAGVTPDDPGDADGALGATNSPEPLITSTTGSSTRVIGTFADRDPSKTYRLDFYRSAACDPSGSGEGAEWIGSATLPAGGSDAIDRTFAGTVTPGGVVTATATRDGKTSEFSECRTLSAPANLKTTISAPADRAPGEDVPHTITVANAGAAEATGVALTLAYGGGPVSFVSASPGCADSAGTVTCAVGTIPAGQSRTRTVTLRRAGAGEISTTAAASSQQVDADPADDAVTAKRAVAARRQEPSQSAPAPAPAPSPPAGAQPVLGRTVTAETVSGVVLVTLPDGRTVPLSAVGAIPVGAVIDATRGRVRIFAANVPGQPVQFAEFYDGKFIVRQFPDGLVDLELVGPVGPCATAPRTSDPMRSRGRARAAQKGAKRKLWGDGRGKFRVSGKHSAAIVRGTKWLVEDSCDGTLTRVENGIVRVVDHAIGVMTDIAAGKSYVAEPRALPVAGRSVNLVEQRDGATVGRGDRALTGFRQVPLSGASVDAIKGAVRVVAAAGPGGTGLPTAPDAPAVGSPTQWATFSEGAFTIAQDRAGLTTLKLAGPAPQCASGARARAAQKKRVRKLWGDGHGKFRVDGKHSAAVVRGTRWLVEDTCNGTLTRVERGVVAVEDFVKKVTRVVRAGGRYLARPRTR